MTGDHQRSVRDVTNLSGVIQTQLAYDPFGRASKIQGSFSPDFQYGSYYYHVASGLSLSRTRSYSPVFGRWINRDPIEEEGGVNMFAYVSNMPAQFTDLSGLDFGDVAGALRNACKCLSNKAARKKCNEDADRIAAALGDMFSNVSNGPPGPSGGPTHDSGDAVMGFVCYQWANAIANAIANSGQSSFDVNSSAWLGGPIQNPDGSDTGASHIHSAVNLSPKGANDECRCRVGFDHGKGFEDGMTHPGGVSPPPGWSPLGDPGTMPVRGDRSIPGY